LVDNKQARDASAEIFIRGGLAHVRLSEIQTSRPRTRYICWVAFWATRFGHATAFLFFEVVEPTTTSAEPLVDWHKLKHRGRLSRNYPRPQPFVFNRILPWGRVAVANAT
jgi:hypothetical protein